VKHALHVVNCIFIQTSLLVLLLVGDHQSWAVVQDIRHSGERKRGSLECLLACATVVKKYWLCGG